MHNFLSDTQTRPTRAMREAVLTAEVGDEQGGADPTTRALEARVAELLGKEAAVFLPSGTMCNEIAIAVHTRPGDELIGARACHVLGFEGGGPAAISGVMTCALDAPRGIFSAEQLRDAVRHRSRYAPRSRLVCVEQTVNMEGGAVWSLMELSDIAEEAKTHGLAMHMDGARLMNAVVARGLPAAVQAADFDSVWIDLTKGLGAPVGAVLAGSAAFIEEAWRFKQMWGGAMRQSGVIAAMGLHALDHHVDRLAEDHARAARMAAYLETLPGVVRVLPADTNIVIWDLAEDRPAPDAVAAAFAERGVAIGAVGPRRLRAVTHLDVDHAAEAAFLAAASAVLG